MKKIIATILIIVGIIFIGLPHFSQFMLEKKNVTEEAIEIPPKKLEENKKNGNKSYDQSKVKPININGVILNRDKADMSKVIGQMTIPAINKNIAIFDGLDNNNLMYGASTMKPKQVMGMGNYCLAGHYCKNEKILFGGLINLKNGDVVKLTNKKNIYEYVIYKTMKVKDDRLDLLSDGLVNEGDGKALLSLMTCYKDEPGYRYFVVAKFSKLYPYSKEKMLDGISE